ncbi:SnoaL-like protein [Hephaestia caeni]|uniref:SnoaL-like protein n=1 Tax=Hephaestia caeni TaxID=645617 RepID=A0A397P7G1_9SPHN|nr:nuclear transport factor 2 family protein [Hephaestia caeni]RIA45486.1 SnoaL-like protein [Hephaestia caeni]
MQTDLEKRLRSIEDRLEIYQLVTGYGYAVDGLNAEAVGNCYMGDGVYALGDDRAYRGRDHIAGITGEEQHLGYVAGGCAHISTVPYIVVEGDRAVATCHTMVARHRGDGFYIARLSASRLELARDEGAKWRIAHRQNYLLDGDPAAPALLGRLDEGPSAASS